MALLKLSEYRKDKMGTMMMLYGPSGTGKTFFSGSAGDDWVFMTDKNGVATLQSKLFKEKVGTNPFIVEIQPDVSPIQPTLFDSLRNQIDMLLTPENKDSFRGIILDDINTTRIGARSKAIDLNGTLGKSKSGVNAKSGKFKDILLPTIADFGTEMSLVEAFLRQLTDALRDEGKHLIICAHERIYRNKDSNIITAVKPLFTGADTPDAIPGTMDLTWYIRTVGAGQNIKREFITESEGHILAKTRWGGLFKPVEKDITAKEVFDRIEKWQKEGKI